MSTAEWSIVVAVVTPVLLALAPWLVMMHARLAVIATRIEELDAKLEKAARSNEQLWSRLAQHDICLRTHDVQLAHFEQRLEECQ